jgi:hypothetical protein
VEIDFNEYNQHNSMWESKPRTMIEKVAIAQAFRKAFPNDMGGMPYTSEELPDEMTTIRDVTPAPTEDAPQTPPEATVTKPQDIQAEPTKAKATPEQTERLKALAKAFSQDELDQMKAAYGHDIALLITKMSDARIAKLDAGTLRKGTDQQHAWASPKVAEALQKTEGSAPEQFPDDSQELYR